MSPLLVRPILTPAKVAKRARVSLSAVYHAIHHGSLEAWREGRELRIDGAAADAFVRGRR